MKQMNYLKMSIYNQKKQKQKIQFYNNLYRKYRNNRNKHNNNKKKKKIFNQKFKIENRNKLK